MARRSLPGKVSAGCGIGKQAADAAPLDITVQTATCPTARRCPDVREAEARIFHAATAQPASLVAELSRALRSPQFGLRNSETNR